MFYVSVFLDDDDDGNEYKALKNQIQNHLPKFAILFSVVLGFNSQIIIMHTFKHD